MIVLFLLLILFVFFIYQPINITQSLKRDRKAIGLLVSVLYNSHVLLIACEYPNELDGLLYGTILNNFVLLGLAHLLNPDSLFTKAKIIWTGTPYLSELCLIDLYQRYF